MKQAESAEDDAGSPGSHAAYGLVSTGVIALNVLVSVVQEVGAKRVLDRVALLNRPRATVIRDGHERQVQPEELVMGDLLVVGAGG